MFARFSTVAGEFGSPDTAPATRVASRLPKFIQVRQLGHVYQADPEYGGRVAAGLGISMDDVMGKAA